jgi:hypothetical protein
MNWLTSPQWVSIIKLPQAKRLGITPQMMDIGSDCSSRMASPQWIAPKKLMMVAPYASKLKMMID